MSEAFNIDVQQRAYNAMLKLHPDQVEHLNSIVSTKRGLAVEEAYHKLTGMLLEPVIARYWVECKQVVLKNPAPLQSFTSSY